MKPYAHQFTMRSLILAIGVALTSVLGTTHAGSMRKGHRLLLKSAMENADFTEVTLPIFER